jgi:hypothetical protein
LVINLKTVAALGLTVPRHCSPMPAGFLDAGKKEAPQAQLTGVQLV